MKRQTMAVIGMVGALVLASCGMGMRDEAGPAATGTTNGVNRPAESGEPAANGPEAPAPNDGKGLENQESGDQSQGSGPPLSAGSGPATAKDSGSARSANQAAQPKGAQPKAAQPKAGAEAAPKQEKAVSPAPGSPGDTGGKASDVVTIKGSNSQGVSDNAIKVGIVAPISGALSFLGEAQVDGIRSYLEDVNARGGVNGRRFQVITVDDQFEPSLEATAIRRLVQQDKVFATFSNLGDSAAPFVTSKGVPNFVAGWTPPAFSSKYPTTYPVNFNTVDYVNIEAYQLKEILKLPIQSTALMYDSQNLPINAWVDYMKRGWEHFGIAVKSIDSFNLSDADCTQLVLKMQRLNIDYWALGQTAGWPICQQAMARQGYSPPLGRGGPYTPTSQFVGQAGAAAKGIYGQNAGVQIRINRGEPYPWSPDGRAPEVDHFVDTIKKYAPQSADYRNVENIWTQMYWVAAKLLTVAISKQTDAITWDGVNRWIQAQDNWVSGLISPHSFRPNCKTGSEAAWMFQWELDEKNQLVQTSWKPYGGPVKLPLKAKEAIVPGAGECYSTAMADAKV